MSVAREEFTFVQQLVRQRSAIVLSDDKDYLVESRLGSLAHKLGLEDAGGLVGQLRSRRDPDLERKVVEALTTNETSWFRDRRPFDVLTRRVFPDIITTNAKTRRIRVWSAACSSGQELYSIAMVLEENFPELRQGWDVQLLGTDLNEEMVRRATAGSFTNLEVNRGLPASLMVRYFLHEGASWTVGPALRDRARFKCLNLAQAWRDLPRFDVIFLRNVLIYFDTTTKADILERAARQMTPAGALFLGAAETPNGLCNHLVAVPVDGTVYYRAKKGEQ